MKIEKKYSGACVFIVSTIAIKVLKDKQIKYE